MPERNSKKREAPVGRSSTAVVGRARSGGGSGRSAAPSVSEIRSAIERQNNEINGLTIDINRANEKLRATSEKFRRAQDVLNDDLSFNSARRLARKERREASDESRALNKIIRDSRRAQNRLIRERDKNQNALRTATQ